MTIDTVGIGVIADVGIYQAAGLRTGEMWVAIGIAMGI